MHFAGIKDQYVEGPPTVAGARTSIPKQGYDNSNIMTVRGGTSLKDQQLTEAKENPATIKVIEQRENFFADGGYIFIGNSVSSLSCPFAQFLHAWTMS